MQPSHPSASRPRAAGRPGRAQAGSGALLLLMLALLGGCAPTPVRDQTPAGADAAVPPVAPTEDEPLTAAIAADDWASVYTARSLAAAEAAAADAPFLWLMAAEAGVLGRDRVAVEAALAVLPVTLDASLDAWRIWLREAVDDRPPDLDGAAARLAMLPPAAAPLFRLRWAEAALAAGRPLDALVAASAVDARAVGPAAAGRASQLAWAAARRSPQAPSPDDDRARGWWALAEVLRNPGLSPMVSLEAWAMAWPGHPAQSLRAAVEAELAALLTPPRRIALLLPLDHGPFAEAAQAVRDGVMAAWMEDAANPERPAVLVIPTGGQGLEAARARAIEAGADLILGPLERESVLELLDGRELPVPTLALNIVPEEERPPLGDPGQRLLQFGLLPEHEAAAAAEYAARQGWTSPALILPEGPWGERLRAAFEARHAQFGGAAPTVARYREGGDYQGLVREVLRGRVSLAGVTRTGGAGAGAAGVEAPGVEAPGVNAAGVGVGAGEPGQPGFIFVAGRSADVRQLIPYLRYYGAGGLPRATTSLTWTGQVAPDQDLDLDGTLITEVPWLLDPPVESMVSPKEARAAWPRRDAAAWRLFAFGLDAYRLALGFGDLRLGRVTVLEGATGQLTLDAGGTVRNRPAWAVFRGGRPRALRETGVP